MQNHNRQILSETNKLRRSLLVLTAIFPLATNAQSAFSKKSGPLPKNFIIGHYKRDGSYALAEENPALPEITVTPEIEIAAYYSGIDLSSIYNTSPPDQFFSDIAGYLYEAMRTTEFYAEMVKNYLNAPVEYIRNWLLPYEAANFYEDQNQGISAYEAWRKGAYDTNAQVGVYQSFGKINASKATAPFAGLTHYIFGNGSPVISPIENMSLSIEHGDIGINGESTGAIPLNDFINSKTSPGSYHYNSNSFGYSTYQDNWFTGKFIGSVSMQVDGVVNRNQDGSWDFQGNARASVSDVYDANRSTYRDPTNEDWTTLLSRIPGQSYEVIIPGQLPLSFSGK